MTRPVTSEKMPENRSPTGLCSGPGKSAAGLMSIAVRRPDGGGRDGHAPVGAGERVEEVGDARVLHRLLEAAHLHLLPQPVAPAGLARGGGGAQHDQIDVGLLGGLEEVGQEDAALRSAGWLHVEQAAVDAARDQHGLPAHRSQRGRQARRVDGVDHGALGGRIDARRRGETRRTARLQRQHAHVGLVERAGQLPDRLLERLAVGELDDEAGADLREQPLGRAFAAPQDAIALVAGDDVELGALRQVLERRAVLEDGILGDVEGELGVGLGLGQQHRGDALELLRRAGRERLAGLVDEAPVALLGGLGGERGAAVRLGRQRAQMQGGVLEGAARRACRRAGRPARPRPSPCRASWPRPSRCGDEHDDGRGKEQEAREQVPHRKRTPRRLADARGELVEPRSACAARPSTGSGLGTDYRTRLALVAEA